MVLVGILLGCGNAAAAPTVQVKGKTRIALDRVHRVDADFVEITGHLVDLLTGDGIAHQHIDITLGGVKGSAITDSDGRFVIELASALGTQRVDVQYSGGMFIDPAQLADTVDPSRAQTMLVLRADPSATGVHLTVEATVDDKPTVLPIQLAISGVPDPTHPRAPDAATVFMPLAMITTDRAFDLTRAAAGGTGARRIRATFAGDDARQTATAEVALELSSATTTSIQISTGKVAYEDKLAVTGKVVDEDGHPVVRAAITLAAGDRRLAQGATAADGTYQLSVEGAILGQGQWGVQVASDPATPYLRPSRSSPGMVVVAAPQPVPVSYTIAAFAATALAAGGFFLLRSKPWKQLRRAKPPAEVPEGEPEREQAGGIVMSRPGLVSTLRRAYDEGFSGLVRDTVRGRPVEGALIRLQLGDELREVMTAADGTFVLEKLTVGEWRAAAAADGLVTETFVVAIPHRGELRGVRVDLVPVRERVFQLYRRAAEPALPESRLWGIWSPRQIVDHVRSRRPSPALADLTDFVEEVYFSSRVAPEAVLSTAAERVDRAVQERAPKRVVASPAEPPPP